MWWPFTRKEKPILETPAVDDVILSMDKDLQQFMASQIRTTTGVYTPIEAPEYQEEKSISANMAETAGVSKAESKQMVANAVSLNCLDFQEAFQKCAKEKYAVQCNGLLKQFHDCLTIQTQTFNQLNYAQQSREEQKEMRKKVDKAFMTMRPQTGQEGAYLTAVGL
ncbi:hypothetical protein B0I72DRAFT_135389 [Yarrowia lipolytica]|jgi:hypothetical protein|uniref:YALI0F12045p n=2 Tax=Yarrowia lipolytica TaxID=4952 RepID=Q6C1Z8_YARLI|nr:YALI0F12045p [Yarrowia lipolytica CLIB122]AOW07032.1 hypothetical protein YALI1_F15886g [Yarrowia lipolytica]KAB8282203.1 hypothetical protein BKA91DRAFT_138843 [Yarrowia lipolytica]KAE8172823.1 hypothetical protein BKA90DRAFT_136651 [Yarrowia lipolytica]KAJ8055810.1 hypothetical protein LXG23DRAFT_57340 [Yarrowia lipolytica]QNQ00691.1 Hypothetical protein YALI2_F00236g [Yarrowia lipolytica]|eukprot:XP_505314.1 YALI0F12045p [Yarrowia lipolytica CLIB122]